MNKTNDKKRKNRDELQRREQLIERGRLLHSQAIYLTIAAMIVYIKNSVLKKCHLSKSQQDLKYS
jgi:hypothetical protein